MTAARGRGFTLIELLIGLAIGLLVILAVLSILLNVTQSSARVVQTQDVSAAVRASVGYANRRLVEAGFGVKDGSTILQINPGVGSVAGNSARFASRTVADPIATVLPGETQDCVIAVVTVTGKAPELRESCNAGPPQPIMTGVVAFEVHSGCSANAASGVARYTRGECALGEVRRTVRTALLVRANAADPVVDRLVAEDNYTFPTTVENTSGAKYIVPTGAAGLAAGCVGSGDCRQYKHRLLVSENVPRNELLRKGVEF